MNPPLSRVALGAAATSVALVAIFALCVLRFRADLRAEIRERMIGRDAAVLYPVALEQLAENESASPQRPASDADLLQAVLKSAQQEGMLAVAVFDSDGNLIRAVPQSLLFAALLPDDYVRLVGGQPLSRFHAEFAFDRYFAGVSNRSLQDRTPVLEVLLPLHGRDQSAIIGFAQYYIDARPLARELALIDQRVTRETSATLAIGAGLISAIMMIAYLGLRRAQRMIAERNTRLTRANFELTLSAKASALGQITSHLIHGLQGPVAGLKAVVAARNNEGGDEADWQSAAAYTERLQTLIRETVDLLSDSEGKATYELTGRELTAIIRDRNATAAATKGVKFEVSDGPNVSVDNHRGGLLCLIAANLVQNAIDATEAGRRVSVSLLQTGRALALVVADEGSGIPDSVRQRLFEPGVTARRGGSGLGLAISRLLARQINAELSLEASGPGGTCFRILMPLDPTNDADPAKPKSIVPRTSLPPDFISVL